MKILKFQREYNKKIPQQGLIKLFKNGWVVGGRAKVERNKMLWGVGGGGEPTDDGNVLAFLIFKYFIQHHALEEIIGATRYIFIN